ncbi:transcriptional regulator SpxA [Oceanobacillus kimchii]|uniref:Global transcriptional regulator Spx n=1 Tax=Oceanobacillus kimchii TaxID=746691 RepID=A0ABQ5TQC2_9BACI|nr:transcriptional regulator SpxA [Oceanobacillus kimchii]GLO68432.1 regulatory protein Spx 1 [Oceanobacillus kimchii]
MTTLYVTRSCTSCRKAKVWFRDNDLPFVERNMISEPLTIDEIKEILRFTEYGTEEIISTRSKVFQEMNIDLDQLRLKELYHLIGKYPAILKSPIIIDEKRMQVGFHEEEIRRFLPRSVRTFQFHELKKRIDL